MKVAALILVVFAASASAGLFDGMLSVTLANSYLKSFSDGVGSEITIMYNGFIASISAIVNILVMVGQNSVAFVTSFGIGSASLIVTVTLDAVEYSAYIALNIVSITVSQLIIAPYNAVVASANSLIIADIARLNLLVITGQVKYTCVQSIKVYIDGNVTEFRAEVRQKRDDHNKKIKEKSDALTIRINDDFEGFKKNITETCGAHSGSSEVGCDVNQYLVLRPEIKQKQRDYVKQVNDDADENRKDAETKSQELQASFKVRYDKIKADIKKCSA